MFPHKEDRRTIYRRISILRYKGGKCVFLAEGNIFLPERSEILNHTSIKTTRVRIALLFFSAMFKSNHVFMHATLAAKGYFPTA